MGGFMAGQATAGEEIQRLARQAEAQAIYRDTVEVVSAAKESVAIEPIKPEPEPRRWSFRRSPRRRKGAEEEAGSSLSAKGALFEVEPVVDTRV